MIVLFLTFLDEGSLRYSNQFPNLLEIYYNGGWSHICRFNWDQVDSDIACKQLGYTSVSYSSYTTSTQIATSFPTDFGEVKCTGSEASLIECSYSVTKCHYKYNHNYFHYYRDYGKVTLFCNRG